MDFGGILRLFLIAVTLAAGLAAGESTANAATPGLVPGWKTAGIHRSQELQVLPDGKTGFQLLSSATTGLDFTNYVPESRHWTNQLLLDGGGVTASDFDGDGRPDLFFTGQNGLSSLWRNLGDWQFTNVTVAAFGDHSALAGLDALGCAFADLNGDGHPDLVVNSHGQGTFVFINDGQGHFTALPQTFNTGRGGYTVAIADIDGDGWLDLYICNYRVRALMDMPNARATLKTVNGHPEVATVDGRPTTEPDLTNRFIVNARGGVDEVGEPDIVYRNLGGTNFEEVSWTSGAFLDAQGQPLKGPLFDWGLSAMFRDLNGDGRPELYVCNDFQSADRLWWNESRPGQIRLRAASPRTLRHTSFFSMGIDFADLNRDGHDDFIVLDMLGRDHRQRLTQLFPPPPEGLDPANPDTVMQYPVNAVQFGRDDGTFAEVAAIAGLQATEWSWTPAFIDVDLDGWEDLLVTNGQWRAARDLDVINDLKRLRRQRRVTDAEIFEARKAFPRFAPPKLAFRNDRHGSFVETGHEWGFDTPAVAHGLCLVDLDGDGDFDIVVNQLNGPALLYRNETPAPRLAIRLRSEGPNQYGIGATIRVTPSGDPNLPVQSQQITAGGRYLSGDAPERIFAAGHAAGFKILVQWPDGRSSQVTNAVPNHRYELKPEAFRWSPEKTHPPTIFSDVSRTIAHTNTGESFDEFSRQPLLPRKLFTEGPGVTWADLNGDGRDELIIGGGQHGVMTIFTPHDSGDLRRWTNVPVQNSQTTLLPWAGRLLVGESTYAEIGAIGHSLSTWPPGPVEFRATQEALGPVAVADVDGGDDLEVFAGGRVLAGRWPAAATSVLLKVSGNTFSPIQTFSDLGLVTASVFTDLNQDGRPDLAMATEWGPLKLFLNESNRLTAWNPNVVTNGKMVPLSELKGWWTSIQAGDFDGDGRPDLAAGNWGENAFQALYGSPLTVFHGEMLGTGGYEVLEAYAPASVSNRELLTAPTELLPTQGLNLLASLIPALNERFRTHRAYAEVSIATLLGPGLPLAHRVDAGTFSSVLLLNRGDHFELSRLPEVVQWSPVWGLVVADWDGDGNEDLFVAQNFFGWNHGLTRNDSGQGVLLRGDGHGGFTALDSTRSGIRIEGEGRGAATADFDRDGRPDLAVAQFGGETRLYRNELALPGLRVRLAGPSGNPLGAGASLRLTHGNRTGPAREIRLGGGHWSCDSATVVLARPETGPAELSIRWPGGKQTVSRIESSWRDVIVHLDGSVTTTPRQ